MSRLTMKSVHLAGPVGRIGGSLFFLVFLGMGLLFCGFIGREFYLNARTYGWQAAECVILESRVNEQGTGGKPYTFAVRYEYPWQGRTYSAEKVSRQPAAFSDFSKAQALADAYTPGARATCFVDPANPTEALLRRPTLWIGAAILLPLVFVAIGFIGIVAMWTKSPSAREAAASASARAISSQPKKPLGARAGAGFFAVFFLIGAVVFYFMTLRPLLGIIAARDWTPTPCTVISSRVQSHRGDDSTTYRVDILYAYELNGREYRSNRYHFLGGSSSGYKAKAQIVRRHPVGARTTCYVNPRDPGEAVLERGFTREMWFGAIPVVFMLIGAGGVIGMLRKGRAGAGGDPAMEPVSIREIVGTTSKPAGVASMLEETSGSQTLKPASSRIFGVIVIGIFAAIWNGAIFFGFIQGSGFFRRGPSGFFDWFTALFMLPFLAVGLVMLAVFLHQLLALFNPKARADIQPRLPRLGGRLEFAWQLTGRTRALRNLKIFLEAREEATYRRGTSTYTDKKPFLKLELASTNDPAEMAAGRAGVTLPTDTVATFKSDNHRIVWSIHLQGDIPRWPDLREEFEIQVLPPLSPDPA